MACMKRRVRNLGDPVGSNLEIGKPDQSKKRQADDCRESD